MQVAQQGTQGRQKQRFCSLAEQGRAALDMAGNVFGLQAAEMNRAPAKALREKFPNERPIAHHRRRTESAFLGQILLEGLLFLLKCGLADGRSFGRTDTFLAQLFQESLEGERVPSAGGNPFMTVAKV